MSMLGVAVFAKRIKIIREKLGHSQESFAELLGFTKTQVYRWEKGDNEPSADTIALISNTLNITADYLLGLVDDPTGYITETALSPQERKLLVAIRSGAIVEAVETTISLAKQSQKGVIPRK